MIDKVPEELWMEVLNIVQKVMTKTIPKKKKCKKAKRSSEKAFPTAEKRREAKGKGERERYTQLNAEFQRTAKRDKKAYATLWTVAHQAPLSMGILQARTLV